MIWIAINQNTLKSLLGNPPGDDDELVSRLENALARSGPGSLKATARARFRLMRIYKARSQHDLAIEQGRKILNLSGTMSFAFESKVHLEIANCLDSSGANRIRWAERAVSFHFSVSSRYLARRMAGAAKGSLARWEESLHHRQAAHELVIENGDGKKISDCLASLGALHLQLGDLGQAESLCQQAETVSPGVTDE